MGFIGQVARGGLAGAVGIAAMDMLWYLRYRRGGGKESVWRWEFAGDVMSWDQASAPGQLGRKVERLVIGGEPPESWARSTTNAVHWATGIGWGVLFGAVAGRTSQHAWLRVVGLGPTAWLTSYAILPLAKVYKPIWEYDGPTLAKDLSAHMVFGVVTSAAFTALEGGRA